jgi:hypothetical protein
LTDKLTVQDDEKFKTMSKQFRWLKGLMEGEWLIFDRSTDENWRAADD